MSLPPSEIPSGAMRFNSDSQKLEYWDGSQWVQVHTKEAQTVGGTRGVLAGGNITPADVNTIEYVQIETEGNSVDFGDLVQTMTGIASGSVASSTRGVFGGDNTPAADIDFITFSTTGNAQTFGDLSAYRFRLGGCSNQTRGVFMCGRNPGALTTMDYITISSTGNAVSWGTNSTVARLGATGCASPTRGILAGDYPFTNTIEYITIASAGTMSDFGDLTTATVRSGDSVAFGGGYCDSFSNNIRGLIYGGYGQDNNTIVNQIEFITITTLGNSQEFGDLTRTTGYTPGTSSPTRGVIFGGYNPASTNTIDKVQIMTTGNATNFGDLTQSKYDGGACSNGHGGL